MSDAPWGISNRVGLPFNGPPRPRATSVSMAEAAAAFVYMDRQSAYASELPIRASIQAVSNALRHGSPYYFRGRIVRGNTRVWTLTASGRALGREFILERMAGDYRNGRQEP